MSANRFPLSILLGLCTHIPNVRTVNSESVSSSIHHPQQQVTTFFNPLWTALVALVDTATAAATAQVTRMLMRSLSVIIKVGMCRWTTITTTTRKNFRFHLAEGKYCTIRGLPWRRIIGKRARTAVVHLVSITASTTMRPLFSPPEELYMVVWLWWCNES